MKYRYLLLFAALAASAGARAGSLPAAYESCEGAIIDELGDGRLRTSILQNAFQDGVGYHWMNVRHRADGAEATQRYRVRCETTDGGRAAEVEIEAGAWKKTRPHAPPRAVD